MRLAATCGIFLLVSSGLVCAQRTATQLAYGLCMKDKVANTLRLDFRLDTRNDPLGALWALTANLVRDTNCNIVSTTVGSGGVWAITSSVNLNNNLPASNGCSFSTQDTGNGLAFTWMFLYKEHADRTDIDAGLNRQYTVICNPQNIQNNEAQAAVIPSTPQQPQNVLPYIPVVTLQLLRQTSTGTFVPITANDQIIVGTPVKLRLSYNYRTFDSSKYYGVAGLRTLFADTSSFTNALMFFNDNGCTVSSLAPATAFIKTSNGANDPVGNKVFVQETGDFPIWMFSSTGNVYIKVFYSFCHGSAGFDTVALCNNPCATLSGTGRKRRQSEDLEESESAYIKVKVVSTDQESDKQPTTVEEQTTDITYILIGVCAAVCFILIVLLVIVLCIVRRTKRIGGRETKIAQHSFENKVPF